MNCEKCGKNVDQTYLWYTLSIESPNNTMQVLLCSRECLKDWCS
jgi:hypothetical protein